MSAALTLLTPKDETPTPWRNENWQYCRKVLIAVIPLTPGKVWLHIEPLATNEESYNCISPHQITLIAFTLSAPRSTVEIHNRCQRQHQKVSAALTLQIPRELIVPPNNLGIYHDTVIISLKNSSSFYTATA